MNATPSGTAVSASAALCKVSPSSATEPDTAATAAWISAVTPRTAREIHSARMPCALVSMAASTLPTASWECGRSPCCSRASSPALGGAGAHAHGRARAGNRAAYDQDPGRSCCQGAFHRVAVVRALRRTGSALTIRDVAVRTAIPVYRVEAALNWLCDEKAAERDTRRRTWTFRATEKPPTAGKRPDGDGSPTGEQMPQTQADSSQRGDVRPDMTRPT